MANVVRLEMPCYLEKQKKPGCNNQALGIKDRQRLTLPDVTPVPSALAGLTALFGMGRGDPRRYSHLKNVGVGGDQSPPSRSLSGSP